MSLIFSISRLIRKSIIKAFADNFKSTQVIEFKCKYGDYGIPMCKINRVITLGVGNDICFEDQFLKSNSIEDLILVDPDLDFKINLEADKITLYKNLIDSSENSGKLYDREKLDHSSYRYFPSIKGKYKSISLQDISNSNDNFLSTLLKVDIEGYEFDLIDDIIMVSQPLNIKVITIEFHWNWFNWKSVRKTLKSLKKLSNEGFSIVWISELAKEITLLKNEVVKKKNITGYSEINP